MAVRGKARVDRSTKSLLWRLGRGEIAVISHRDLDSLAARQLVAAGVLAVINADCSFTGIFPGKGAIFLLQEGIPLIDNVGGDILDLVRDGDDLLIDGRTVYRAGVPLAHGQRQTTALMEERLAGAKLAFPGVLKGFVDNTIQHARTEIEGIMGPIDVPPGLARLVGRPVVVVVRGRGYQEDLAAILPYIKANRPNLIAIDGAADAVAGLGLAPDLVFGDMDSISDTGLLSGSRLLVHGYPDGRAPGLTRLKTLGLVGDVFACPGTSEDAALLLAHAAGAQPVVLVGSHSTPLDFLEKGRAGMASTWLVRLKLGHVLIDAQGLHKLAVPGKDFRQPLGAALACRYDAWAVWLGQLMHSVLGQLRAWVDGPMS